MGLVQFDRGCPVLVWSDMGLSGLGLVRAGGVLLITLHAKEDWQSRQAACPDGSAGLRRRWLPSNSSWLMSPPSSQQHIPCYAVFQTVFLPPLWNTKLTPCTLHFTKRMIRIGIREVVMLASKQRCNFLSRPLTPKPTNLPFAVFSNLWQTQNWNTGLSEFVVPQKN